MTPKKKKKKKTNINSRGQYFDIQQLYNPLKILIPTQTKDN